MASPTETQVAPDTARDGFDTRKKDLNVACDETQESAYEEEEEKGPCIECGELRMGDYTEYCVDCYWDADWARKHNCAPMFTSKPLELQEERK
jgi:hypothetical protein